MSDSKDTTLKQKSQTMREIISFVERFRSTFKEPVGLSVVNRKFGKRCLVYGGLNKVIRELEDQGLLFSELSRSGGVFLSPEIIGDPLPLRLVR